MSRLFKDYRRNALIRGIRWNLTIEEFESVITLPCGYCGMAPKRIKRKDSERGVKVLITSKELVTGIDRIDSSKGYDLSNCRPACKRCNQGKNNMSSAQFIEHCKRVAAFKSKKAPK